MIQERWRVRCFGKVQHVGFRYTAMYIAKRLDLTGWVRNLADGSVLLEAQGSTTQLRNFLIQLKSQKHLHITKSAIAVLPLQEGEKDFRVQGGRMDV